jgi:hypothetical protein
VARRVALETGELTRCAAGSPSGGTLSPELVDVALLAPMFMTLTQTAKCDVKKSRHQTQTRPENQPIQPGSPVHKTPLPSYGWMTWRPVSA